MQTKALIFGLIALASFPEIASAQGKGGGANASKPDSVRGINIVMLDTGGPIAQVTWNPIDKATFQVKRSKVGDTCCTNASQPGLTVTSWQDSRLPSSGTYVYRVIATLRSGQIVGQSQIDYTAPVSSGRYRLTIRAVQVDRPTFDDATGGDGNSDEIYVAAAVVRMNWATGVHSAATIVKSKEYGDIGSSSAWPDRIRAGSASASGGLTTGNRLGDPGTPGAETFPFQLWSGDLTDGGEAVVVFPSVWERDTNDSVWKDYAANWMSATAPILESKLLQNQYSSTTLTPVVATMETGTIQQGVTGPIYGSYYIGTDWLSGVDRMIGIVAAAGNPVYPEHMVVLTHEKLAGLAVGGTVDLQIPLNENIPPGGSYTMILRVERIG